MLKALTIVTVAAAIAGSAVAGPGHDHGKAKAGELKCPVMGSKIASKEKAAGKSVYKGKTYYFCCGGCKPMFDKNPEKYVKKAAPKA